MKKTVRLICLLLALLLLCGCSAKTTDSQKLNGAGKAINHGKSAAELLGEKYTFRVQQLPEKVENPDGLPVLKWVCLLEVGAGGPYHKFNEAAMVQFNELLAQRGQPFRLQLVLVMHNVASNYWDWFNVPEVKEALQGADLIFGRLRSSEMKEYLMPITAYAKGEAQPSLENAVPFDHLWDCVSVGNEIYGIRGYIIGTTECLGWKVNKKLLAQSGLTAEDFLGKQYYEMDEVFARIYESNGNQPFLYSGRGQSKSGSFVFTEGAAQSCIPGFLESKMYGRFESIGGLYAIDYGLEEPAVVNVLEYEYFRNCLDALKRYWNAGYVTDEYIEDTIQTVDIEADYVYEKTYEDEPDTTRIYIPAGQSYMQPTKGTSFISGVSVKTEHSEEALALLALLAGDEGLRMHLLYGAEDQDYTITEDGYYENIKHEDNSRYHMDALFCTSRYSGLRQKSSSSDYARIYMPSIRITTPYLDEVDGISLLAADKEMFEDCIWKYPSSIDYADRKTDNTVLAFNFSTLETEIRTIYDVCDNYYWYLTSPNTVEDDPKTKDINEYIPEMTQETYQQMLQDLKEAGSDKVLAELQKQLNDWKAVNLKK